MASSLALVPGITATTGADSTRAVITGAATTGDWATDPTGAALPIVPGLPIGAEDHGDSRVGAASTVAAHSAAAEAGFMVAEATAADIAKAPLRNEGKHSNASEHQARWRFFVCALAVAIFWEEKAMARP